MANLQRSENHSKVQNPNGLFRVQEMANFRHLLGLENGNGMAQKPKATMEDILLKLLTVHCPKHQQVLIGIHPLERSFSLHLLKIFIQCADSLCYILV
jgi:hypothetical protein